MRTILVILLCLFANSSYAEVRVKIYLETTSTITASQVKAAIQNKISTYPLAGRVLDIQTGKGTESNPAMWWGSMFYEFVNATDAEAFYQWAKANMPANVHGHASAHWCPIDGLAPNHWLGCKDDPRANYREVSW